MKYTTGNLIQMAKDGDFDVIVHGCNINCVMGSGIAKAIAEEWPVVAEMDSLTKRGDILKLGQIQPIKIGDMCVVNMYTQASTGSNGQYVSYNAIERGFVAIQLLITQNEALMGKPARIGIPKIGAGLGGGDWDIIEHIIDRRDFADLTCVVYE